MLRAPVITGLLCAACLLLPAGAAAEGYTVAQNPCPVIWMYGSGQADQQGRTYIPCGGRILVLSDTGALLQRIDLAFDVFDVAPSPDGSYLYAIRQTVRNNDQAVRLVRRPDGTYALDGAWRLANYPLGGQMYTPRGRFLATDAWGEIYFSNGMWQFDTIGGVNYHQPLMLLKFAADGRLITQFGGEASANLASPASWEAGKFRANAGLTVSADGRSVWVTEEINGRIERFTRRDDGSYGYTGGWGNTYQSGRVASCEPGGMAAPYDIGVDPWGFTYVVQATCEQIHKYDPQGRFVLSLAVPRVWVGDRHYLTHGLSVDGLGNVYGGPASNRYFRRTTPTPGPVPAPVPLPAPPPPAAPPPPPPPAGDTQLPYLTAIGTYSPVATRTTSFKLAAQDNVAVTQVRLANDDQPLTAAVWRAFAATVTHELSPGVGDKRVTLQVRDAAGNLSRPATVQISLTADVASVPAAGGPLAAKPTITAMKKPVIARRSLTLSLVAPGATQVRVRIGAARWGTWGHLGSPTSVRLHASLGRWLRGPSARKVRIYVQVRDSKGRTSRIVSRRLMAVARRR